MTKWHWPTWADWLQVYDQPVTNLAYKGYGNSNIYWTLLDKINLITSNDHVIVAWTQNHRLNVWYDQDWINEKDVLGFFPTTKGKLWYTAENNSYVGLYRTHPDYQTSYTNMLVDQFQTMLHTQMLLEKIGCKYTMVTMCNPWWDGRPVYTPVFKTTWQYKNRTEESDIDVANKVMSMKPIKNLMQQINWSAYANAPKDFMDPKQFSGIWEYYIGNSEYVRLKHPTDNHPNSLAHHDFALEIILKQDPKKGKHRTIAKQIAQDATSMHVPEFTQEDFIAAPETELLDSKYKIILSELS